MEQEGRGMSDEIKLAPCPFCGSAVVSIGRGHIRGAHVGAYFLYGQCGNCGANGPQSDEKGFFYLKPEDAAAAWNRRAGA